mgnify:CR=1 FL=1
MYKSSSPQDAVVLVDRASVGSAAAFTFDKTGLQYVNIEGISYISLHFYGTYNVTWQVSTSNDLTNWPIANALQQDSSIPSVEKHSQAGSTGTIFSGPTHGARYLRIVATVYTSGTCEVTVVGKAGAVVPSTQPVLNLTDSKTTTFAAPTAASVGVASAQALASNTNRKGLVLVNTSTVETISISIGGTAVLRSGITLLPGGSFTMDDLTFSTAAVAAIASAAATNLSIQEIT